MHAWMHVWCVLYAYISCCNVCLDSTQDSTPAYFGSHEQYTSAKVGLDFADVAATECFSFVHKYSSS